MSVTIEVSQTSIPSRERLEKSWVTMVVRRVLRHLKPQHGILSLVFVSSKEMRSINRRCLGKNRTTDVLSFSLSRAGHQTPRGYWGEVFVCLSEARVQAPRFGKTYSEEIARLIIHGILHIAGYDHVKRRDATHMFSLTDRVLKELTP